MIQLGLIGYPLGHSLSPEIHGAAFKACDLQGKYSLFPIPPDDSGGLKDLLARVRDGEITGLNITIPHKENVIPLLDALSSTARSIGAVNTIFMQNEVLMGDNTDAPGFLADLHRFFDGNQLSTTKMKSALVLGAGGSARAVVYALAQDGWDIAISTRRSEKAQELITQILNPGSRITPVDLSSLNSLAPALIVNTTPVGMSPDVNSSPWPADLPLPSTAAIYDLVYNPRKTKLVKNALASGLFATTGLGMLVEQAALSFETWTGLKVPRGPLFSTLEAL